MEGLDTGTGAVKCLQDLHDTAIALMNYLQLWLPSWNLYEVGLMTIYFTVAGKETHEPSALT